jgi:thiamine pyrophosphokinase
MHSHIANFSEYKSILCLDGQLPSVDYFPSTLPIIAADGAANTLMQMGITPHIVIGDLDSLDPNYREQLLTHYHFDQNYCDFEKSLQYLQANDLLPCMIYGMNGGYLDHILNNVNIFMQASNVFYAPPLCGYAVRESESKSLVLPAHAKLSIMGIPQAVVTTSGLAWELTESNLTFPGRNSCFNRSVSENVEINVHEGNALVLVYQ